MDKRSKIWYAQRNVGKSPHQKTIRMHRDIVGVYDSSVIVDHKNGNGLDNRSENLRICTKSQNRQNSKKRSNNTSGYIGVTWRKDSGNWRVQINSLGKYFRFGGFNNLQEAARVYDKKAVELFGEFAVLNFPEDK